MLEVLFHVASDVMMVHTTHNTLSRFVPEKVPSIIDYLREARAHRPAESRPPARTSTDYLAGDLSVADFAFYPVYQPPPRPGRGRTDCAASSAGAR